MDLIAQMLFMAAGGQGGQASRTTGGGTAANITPATAYTASTLGIGAAASDRLVVASIAHVNSSGATPPVTQTVTIGGVSATQICRAASAYHEASMWVATIPSGTTADVVVGIDRNIDAYAVALTALYGVITAPAYTVQATPTSGGGAIKAIRNGVVLAAMAQSSSYFSGAVTPSANLSTASPVYLPLSVGYAMPTSTGSIPPLSSGTGGFPYVAASFAPK